MQRRNEGFIKTSKGQVWYEIVGKKGKTPIVTIHGGPAYPHDYLEPFVDLSSDREVIFYDQLGCGNSEWPSDESFWNVEYFIEELETLIKALDLKEYVLLGQSWGTALATSLALKNPPGLKGLILADPFLSTPLWKKDSERLISNFPKDLRDAFKTGDHDSEAYKRAVNLFISKHVYGLEDLPVQVMKSDNKMNLKIYHHVWGPAEFSPIGILKDFDITSEIENIKIPVLIFSGRFDEATPEAAEFFGSLIQNSKVKIFEKSAHMPFWNEREECIQAIRDFLTEI